jgi:hypothetical protein
MVRTTLGAVLALLTVLATRPAGADPIAVKYTEGITRGFPVLRALNGGRSPGVPALRRRPLLHGPDLADRLELSEGQAVSQSPSATPAVL